MVYQILSISFKTHIDAMSSAKHVFSNANLNKFVTNKQTHNQDFARGMLTN